MKPQIASNHAAKAIGLAALCAPFSAALAGGVPAGTGIDSNAAAQFTAGSSQREITSNTVTVVVNEVLSVAIASLDGNAVEGTDSAVLTLSVTNTGNGPEAFTLTANPNVAGNDFVSSINALAIDTNANGIYDSGVDAEISNGGTSPVIEADGAFTVFVLASIPASAGDSETSQIELLAEASTGAGPAGTVYSGAGVGGSDAVVGPSGAAGTINGVLVARASQVTLQKTIQVTDQFGGTQPIPGATITYNIEVNVSGTTPVDDLIVSDAIPPGTTYVTGSIVLDATPLTDAPDGDAAQGSAAEISVDFGTVEAGASHRISFQTTIN